MAKKKGFLKEYGKWLVVYAIVGAGVYGYWYLSKTHTYPAIF